MSPPALLERDGVILTLRISSAQIACGKKVKELTSHRDLHHQLSLTSPTTQMSQEDSHHTP